MNNKIVKNISFILVFILSFFFFNSTILAAGVRMTSIKPTIRNNYTNYYYYLKNVNNNERSFSGIYVFAIADSNNANPKQVYCIQPGVSLGIWGLDYDPYRSSDETIALTAYKGSSESSETSLNYNSFYTDSNLKTRLLQVLNYTYEYNPNKDTLSNFATAATSISNDNFQKIIASQTLVWEVVTKERTNFTSDKPDQKISNDMYDVIFGKSAFATAKEEYKRIRNAVYYSYYRNPGNNNDVFKIESQAKTIQTTIGQTYEIKDSNNAFKYFKILSTTDGITANISSDGSSLKITTTKAISADSPGIVKISLKDVKPSGVVYACTQDSGVESRKGCQDLAYGGVDNELAIKVYTSKYEIKIIKKDENGVALSGAKFDICKDSKCNTILNTQPLVSGSDGTVTYKEITEPGTYYIKEKDAPSGYVIDSTIKAVTIPNSSSVTFTNTARKFNLTKYTVDENGNNTLLDDGCGTEQYTGPEFELTDSSGNLISFEMLSDGEYKQADDNTENPVNVLKTCYGKFSVKLLTSCNYTISEKKAPDGLTLPSNATRAINICGADKNISFTNGFTGLEFQKKNEDGEFISGGKFALQRKENNVYKDVLLREDGEGYYTYDTNLKESDESATYILLTDEGIARIEGIAPGEYRIVEKEAPEDYEPIEDKDSTAKITINDGQQDDYYVVELINKKINLKGDEASAELIVTITTGRKVLNYTIIFISLAVILAILILFRKKLKK